MSLSDDFARAKQLHEQGNLPEAETLYRAILQADPRHADAWHLLGQIAHQANQHEPAVQCIEHAIQLDAKQPAYYHSLAVVQHRLGRTDVAATLLERLLKLEPNNVDVHAQLVQLRQTLGDRAALGLAQRNLGNALAATGRLKEALQVYRQALEARPQDVELLNNLGVACMELGHAAQAIGYYQRAIAIRPRVAELHNNLGNAFVARRETDAAAAAYRQALAIKPNYPKCSNNLAVLLIGAGRFEEAVAALREALNIRPDLPELHSNLGVCLKNLGRMDEAMQAYRQAITVDPRFVDAHHNLGNLLLDAQLLDKAALAYRQAIELKPDDAEFHQHLALTYKRQGDAARAKASLAAAMALDPQDVVSALRTATLCPMIYESRDALAEQRGNLATAIESFRGRMPGARQVDWFGSHAEYPFNAQFFDGDLRPLRTAYAELFAPLIAAQRPPARSGAPRIGFVLTKGHEGVFLKSLRGVLQRLDRALCEPVIIAPPLAVPRIVRELAPATLEIIHLPERRDHILSVLDGAQLDVLYHWEVGTDAVNYFLPLFRLAPVQCTSWGIQQTSGMTAMDYYLSSALVEPPDAAAHYSETLLLADTLLTYQFRPEFPTAGKTRNDFGLRDDQHVYTCAQHLGKFHPDFDALLGEILRRDGHGVLCVTEDRYSCGAALLRQRWQRTMADVADRIVWLPRLPEADYRSLLAASDVLLDPPHFGGVNSTYDGLALAKPIVTCPSAFQRGRYTFGCYQKMQLTDCVARDAQHYVELAVRLGTDAPFRRHTSERIAQASDALWEDAAAVRAHEKLFEKLLAAARQRAS